MRTAEVAAFAGLRGPAKTFTYAVPDGLTPAPGSLVRIALGPRTATGLVVALDVPPTGTLKEITALASPAPVLREHQLALATWIAERYRCGRADALRAMLPPLLLDRARRHAPDGPAGRERRPSGRVPRQLMAMRALATGEADAARDAPPTDAQRAALAAIAEAIGTGRGILLHGVTGSGKTEVYLRSAAVALARGLGVVMLVPEIALTPQAVARVVARFGDRVALLHSGLAASEREAEWRRALDGTADVVVGSRSALFAPLARVGLIVVDEEQEPSYKQESAPRYHAVDAALELGRLTGAAVVLGSATPRVVTYHAASTGALTLCTLPGRIAARPMPETTVVDLRLELRGGNHGTLSLALRSALVATLARREQALLYLDRRGFATVVLCRDCGHVESCPGCEIPFVWHADGALVCHRCGRRVASEPERCPDCGSARIRHLGAGTQRVEDEVRTLFPKVPLLRLDRDAVRARGAHAAAFARMRSGEARVLVGTQMLAKGFDLPEVTLVGVVNADIALNLPDYTAGERAFELLTQVLGRSGRSDAGGRGILQTYLPEHYAVRAAAAHDYATFAAAELAARRRFGYPPFGRLVLLQTQAKREDTLTRRADALATALRAAAHDDAEVLGPAPAFAAKRAGWHRVQLVLRGPRPERVLDAVEVGGEWTVDVDPVTLLG